MPSPQQSQVYVDRSRSEPGMEREKEKRSMLPTLLPTDADSFLALMADILHLQEEALTMAFVYINRYRRWLDGSADEEELLDDHTLALASLSLATKATESPRRLREFLLPAYAILHPTSPVLTFPSSLYDTLRSTLVAAELLLLRILKFELRITLPYEYLPRLLDKLLHAKGADYSQLSLGTLEGSKVVEARNTSLGREVWRLVAKAMMKGRICNFFPARVIAVAVVWVVVGRRGWNIAGDSEKWVEWLTSGRVEAVDFWEAVEEVKAVET